MAEEIPPTVSPVKNNGTDAGADTTPKQSSIHTLEGDIFRAVNDKNYSNNIVKIATQASHKQTTAPTDRESNSKKIIFLFVLCTVLIVGVGAWYIFSKTDTPTINQNPDTQATTTLQHRSILEAEALLQINLKELSKAAGVEKIRKIQSDLREKKITRNTMVELELGLTTADFFEKNRYSGDESLIRALTTDYSFGVYNNKNNVFETFVLFKVDSFDTAFSSMLNWEPYLPLDFNDMFFDGTQTASSTESMATSTATSSPVVLKKYTPGFKDVVIKNTDTRVYTDEDGIIQFVYGFINKDYLIISGGIESFVEIKERLLNKNILR